LDKGYIKSLEKKPNFKTQLISGKKIVYLTGFKTIASVQMIAP